MISESYLHLGDYSKAEEIGRAALALLAGTGHSWPRGFIAWWLGVAYLMLQKYPEARGAFQLNQTIALNQANLSGMADLGLSMLEFRLGNFPQVWQHIHKALPLMVDQQSLYLNYGLSIIALLLAGRGEVEQALELYTLVIRFPMVANSCWFADFFGKPIQSASASLPAEVVAAAQQRGQLLDARETAHRLIADFDTQG